LQGRDFIEIAEFALADLVLGAYARRWYGLVGELARPILSDVERWYQRVSTRTGFRQYLGAPLSWIGRPVSASFHDTPLPMTITLHTWNTPNGRKISVALEEMQLPYTVRTVNISKGEQHAPDFLRISPNNRIPAIVDSDGPDGQPISIFESGAILLYLGEKTGKFLPASLRERVPVLEWLMWQMGGFGPMPGQVHHFRMVESEADRRYGLKRYSEETRRLYGVLDLRLADVEFVAGDLSVADFAILGWAWRHERHQVSLDDFPNVKRWYEALFARPGVQRGFAVKLDAAE
jgi:GST-like protein